MKLIMMEEILNGQIFKGKDAQNFVIYKNYKKTNGIILVII